MKKTGAVLAPLLKNLGLESSVRLVRIRHDWYGIFDEPITSHLFPVSFSEKELLLHVTSPIWMQQFSYHKSEILKKLSAYGVEDIRFRLGRIPQRKQEILPDCKAPELTRENRFFIAELLSDISDETLKETIKKAVEKSLTSRTPQRSD
ncbi:MAG: hypothetical protein CVV37_05085 [Nitrospira bacterium HGW-Nitrospira-1]|nr:MAG: hypothetical protein CVV37_05085 [Nitrospira bacterium HGW-Nitrospira-1]